MKQRKCSFFEIFPSYQEENFNQNHFSLDLSQETRKKRERQKERKLEIISLFA
jgi:hypothetical protein